MSIQDLRCFTVHLYFRAEGAKLFGGEPGYVETKLGHCQNVGALSDKEQYDNAVLASQKMLAAQLQVDVDKIVPISYQEYSENTDEEDDE